MAGRIKSSQEFWKNYKPLLKGINQPLVEVGNKFPLGVSYSRKPYCEVHAPIFETDVGGHYWRQDSAHDRIGG